MRFAGRLGLAATLAVAATAGAGAQEAIPDGDWRTINRDLAATRYSPLNEIDRSNVAQLAQAWSYPMRGYNTAVPLVIDGIMYFPASNRVVALDADTGKELWTHDVPRDPNQRGFGGVSIRGVGYWPGDAQTPPRILVMVGSKMLALEAARGTPVAGFGKDGSIDVGVGYGGTPTIFGDIAVIGAATLENPVGVPGNPRAFDLRTGRKLWEFQTVPRAGERFNETWGEGWKDRSGTNMWAFAAPVDAARKLVFLPISSPAPNYWGGSRPGINLFGNSVVAVDIETGEYRWHFQTVHHDLWDFDMPSAGALIEVDVDGRRRPAIANVGKTSYFFLFDAETGQPLHPVEERPVPKGDVPGEYYHPTQPFPVKTPPLSRVSMTPEEMVTAADTTPEHAAACKALWDKSGGFINKGPFTPFFFHEDGTPPRSTIQLPGGIGGVNWGGPAADPTTGIVYVNAHDTSLVGWVEKKDPNVQYSFDTTETDQPYDRASVNGKGPFFGFQAPISGKYDENGRPVGASAPCYKGPWARLTAVDANSGEIKWAVPLGLIEELPEGKQLLGNSGSAGPTVTAGGLVFVGATNDKRFRAFDAANGRQLWEAKLGNSANANPMTYRGKSGRQYVAINAGGTIVAFSLRR
jgi:quinoprotein glucose dehydrogenase